MTRQTSTQSRIRPHKPPHWPSDVEYISEPSYHSSVPTQIRSLICPRSLTSPHVFVARSPVIIRRISEATHPANEQYGLFAAKKISPRTHILDYLGEVHCEDRLDSDYDLSLYRSQDGVNVGIDARRMGNEARFINDFRGVGVKPNAVFEERRTATGELRMGVWSGGDWIKKGDEVLVSYGKMWWHVRSLSTSEHAAETEVPS
ncbi:hypothetical protein AcW1_000355 [Taiwanofungus camphoratus]|nr:hypothetical protein AcW2_001151 [Antrodia cinnamomea]KAI0935999.1 hypothetical protein AcV5_004255 [Antrodia cinnamomea]KAI0961217.1 hypothetical protein AcV7_000375 [Antrodia cinnamomea]KAI0963214.1 hypothetical protein AcW1_000355 [Antrodia cinnamomea]